MSKRSLEETGHAKEVAATNGDLPAKKKRREDKNTTTSNGDAADQDERQRKAEKKELKRLKKLKKLEKQRLNGETSETIETQENTPQPTDETPTNGTEEIISKKEKKEKKSKDKKDKKDKKEKKEKKSMKSADGTADDQHSESTLVAEQPVYNKQPSTGYSELATLSSLEQSKIDEYLAKHFISVTDPKSTKPLRPIIDFSYLEFESAAQKAPFSTFAAPTPIQAAAWPHLLNGRDVIGVAETGSGKTMAFSLPCVRYIAALPRQQRGVKAVIVCPTRELAMQGYEQVDKLAKSAGLKSVCIYGGVPKEDQRRDLKTADIVVATPGRLNDLIDEGSADLSKAGFVVLDEADRMLDKGFEDDIKKIIGQTLPLGKRQTVMFTATWPESVRSLASTFMTSPVRIMIGDNPDGDLRANTRITQKVEVVDQRDKEQRLLQLLKQHQSGRQKDDRILVFCLYKKEATRVEGFIRSRGIRVSGIHGDMTQDQRTKSLESFKNGSVPVLVATDVAARGLDIPAVKLVINCTFPLTVEDYVHRIGRTGRAGKDGLAITLFTEHDKAHSGALINILRAANQEVPENLLKFGTTVKKKEHGAYGAFFKEVDNTKKATKIRFD